MPGLNAPTRDSAPLTHSRMKKRARKKNQRPKEPTMLQLENLMSSVKKPNKVQLLHLGNTEIHNATIYTKSLLHSTVLPCPAVRWKSTDNYWYLFFLKFQS